MDFIALYKLQDKLQDYILKHPSLLLQQHNKSLLLTDNSNNNNDKKKTSFLGGGGKYVHKQSLDRFLTKKDNHEHDDASIAVTRDAIDLISRLLVYDPKARLTSEEALEHRFFTICSQFIDPSIIMNHPRDEWNNLPISIKLG